MNMFVEQRPVSAPSLGHQTIIVQESGYTGQKLQIINQQISSLTSECIKNICQECSIKQYKKYKTPKTC